MQHVDLRPLSPTPIEPRPLGELFAELAGETGTLVRKEIELAKTEMSIKATIALKHVALVAVGGVICLAGGLALLAAAVLALGTLIPLWLSALTVGVLVAGLGGALALGGLSALKKVDPAPRQTIQTLKENQRWVREQAAR